MLIKWGLYPLTPFFISWNTIIPVGLGCEPHHSLSWHYSQRLWPTGLTLAEHILDPWLILANLSQTHNLFPCPVVQYWPKVLATTKQLLVFLRTTVKVKIRLTLYRLLGSGCYISKLLLQMYYFQSELGPCKIPSAPALGSRIWTLVLSLSSPHPSSPSPKQTHN